MAVVRMLALALIATIVSLPGVASADSDFEQFTDPSGAVVCQLIPQDEYVYQDHVRCDLLGGPPPGTPLPPRPGDCPADWSATARLAGGELAEWGACVGDSISGGPRLGPGETVTAGVISCTTLDTGVSCRDTELGYGFQLTATSMTLLRPQARPVLTPEGVGKLKLGMTKKKARRTGYLAAGEVCGSPQLKRTRRLSVYLTWRRDRFDGLLANHHTNAQATKGVGVGSSLGEVQARYRGRVRATTDHVQGERAYVFMVRGKRGTMVFILDTPSTRSPVATDPVGAVWVTRRFNPKAGFGFSGC